MKRAEAFCRGVDAVNTWVAKAVQWLCLPLVIIVTIEVIARYVFNSPTIWSWDISIQLMALLATLGSGYGLLQGSHVRVDILISRFSRRVNLIVDLIMSTIFFFGIGLLLRWFGEDAVHSVAIRQPWESLFRPPIYPLKVLMLIGIGLLLLQGLAKFIRDLIAITHQGQGNKS